MNHGPSLHERRNFRIGVVGVVVGIAGIIVAIIGVTVAVHYGNVAHNDSQPGASMTHQAGTAPLSTVGNVPASTEFHDGTFPTTVVTQSQLSSDDLSRSLDLDGYCESIHEGASTNPHKQDTYPNAAYQWICIGNGAPISMQDVCNFDYPDVQTQAVSFATNRADSWRCHVVS
jgi:hypothetical protein